MKIYSIAVLASTLMLVVAMTMATPGFADEPLKITGEVREGENDGTRLKILPTDRGMVIVTGELVKGQPASVVLLEGARSAQLKVTPHTHTQVMTIHRTWEEELASQVDCIQSCP